MRTSLDGDANLLMLCKRLIFNNLQPIGVGVVAVVGLVLAGLTTSINAHTLMK